MLSNDCQILVKPLFHRKAKHIGLFFEKDVDIISKIKTIEGRKYSATHRCWYIPYTKSHFKLFTKLNFSYKVVTENQTHEVNQQPCKSLVIPSVDSEESQNNVERTKERGKSFTTINKENLLKKIIWNAGNLFIYVDYNSELVSFIKGLSGAYWHSKGKYWVCKGYSTNIIQLQNRFQYWSDEQFEKLNLFSKNYFQKPKVYFSPHVQDSNKMEIKPVNCPEALQYIKSISGVNYISRSKIFVVDKKETYFNDLKLLAKEHNFLVFNKVTWSKIDPIEKSKDGRRKLKAICYHLSREEVLKFKPYLEVFLRHQYSYNTMKNYFHVFRKFFNHYGSYEVINQMSEKEVEKYLNTLACEEISYQELNRHISAIKFYYHYVMKWSDFRLQTIKRPRRPQTLPIILSAKQIEKLLNEIQNLKHRCMIGLAYGCGLRAGEITGLKVQDVLLDRMQLFVRHGKGRKDRVLNIPKSILPVLEEYYLNYKPDYWFFRGQNMGHPYSASSLRSVFKRACKAAQLPKGLKLHSLRHSFATHMMDHGVQLRIIQQMLGHSSSKTTEIYTHVSKQTLDNIVSPLDRINAFDKK